MQNMNVNWLLQISDWYWGLFEPNVNGHLSEDCVTVAGIDGRWQLHNCTSPLPYICQKPPNGEGIYINLA